MRKTIEKLKHKYNIEIEDESIILTKLTDTKYDWSEEEPLVNSLKMHKKCALSLLKNPPKEYREVIGVDIETTELKPRDGEIKLIGLYGERMSEVTEDLEGVRDILEDPSILKVFHNALFDVTWLLNKGYTVNSYTDTMIISQILNNRSMRENSLKHLMETHLGIQLEKELQNADNWRQEITEKHKQYCLKDAQGAYLLYNELISKAEELHLEEVIRREIEALPAVVELQENGIGFDFEAWKSELEKMNIEAERLLTKVRTELDSPNLNLRSSKQVIEALRTVGIVETSSADKVLAKYSAENEFVRDIRTYRKLSQRIRSLGEDLKKKIDKDGRIRGNWRLIGANTSRMTCSKPNLQGLPRVARKYFKPKEGYSFVIADYSNIELRILADISRDEKLMTAFKNNEDVHTNTTRIVLGKGEHEEISSEERKIGKVVNFGLVYGMGAKSLMDKINNDNSRKITEMEAEKFRKLFFKEYDGILEYQDRMLRSGHIETLGGRYWNNKLGVLPPASNARYNYPIQASGAEGLKEAMNELFKKKPEYWKIVAIVHDEIVLEVPDDDAVVAAELLESTMILGMSRLVRNVPIKVDVSIGKNWEK
jgi:DNA polymerase I-like protein with 3'-5' exonuclease and polymerase domains